MADHPLWVKIASFAAGAGIMFGMASAVLMTPGDMLRWIQRDDSMAERVELVFSAGEMIGRLKQQLEDKERALRKALRRNDILEFKVTDQETTISGLMADRESFEHKLAKTLEDLKTTVETLDDVRRESAKRTLPSAHRVALTRDARRSFYDGHVHLELKEIIEPYVCRVEIYSEEEGAARELSMRSGFAHIFRAMGRDFYLVMLEKTTTFCKFDLFPRQVGTSFR